MAAPRIGCIAWGSLLWDPRTLPLAAPFVNEGPLLPIEFSRVALDGRVTLVIDPLASPDRTWWAPLAVESLAGGIAELARREGIAPERVADWIGVAVKREVFDAVGGARSSEAIDVWLASVPLDAVLWTALPMRRPDGRFERPSEDELVAHLARLDPPARARAEQYIRRAPARLATPNRRRFEAEFGWTANGRLVAAVEPQAASGARDGGGRESDGHP